MPVSAPSPSSSRPAVLGFAARYPWVLATLVVVALTLGLHLAGAEDPARWIASAYALVVAAWTSVGMVRDLMRGHWGVDILAVTAIVATVLVGEHLAAVLVCLMLTGGEALEDYAAGRARRDLSALLDRAPQRAHRLGPDGSVEDVPVEEVRAGDRLLVRPAEVLPVDGTVASAEDGGEVAVDLDESSLTGESLPVTHRTGSAVMSGALNGTRAFVLEATASAADSQYAAIVSLVQQAAESRAPMVRLADRYAVPFTAVAYLIAGLAWWLSQDPVRFAEVLVVATPCPLLIAAPVAFLGGMSRAATSGVIVKSGGTIEALGSVQTVGFDKTGTLTAGRPELVGVRPAAGFAQDELLRLAASAEQYSVHVLAYVTQAAPDTVTADLAPGQSAVYVAVDGAFAGVLLLADRIRPESAATVQALHRLGARQVLMLTGDAEATGRHIAREAGIDEVHADLLPADKVRLLSERPERPVMMVGDGVNDVPVLAAADVGVAMGARGSTAASESADVVVLADDVSKVAVAVAAGQRTLQVATQSIWVGIALSLVLMVIAATGAIPALVGALFQELVDVVAIVNALRAMKPGPHEAERLGDLAAAPARGERQAVSA